MSKWKWLHRALIPLKKCVALEEAKKSLANFLTAVVWWESSCGHPSCSCAVNRTWGLAYTYEHVWQIPPNHDHMLKIPRLMHGLIFCLRFLIAALTHDQMDAMDAMEAWSNPGVPQMFFTSPAPIALPMSSAKLGFCRGGESGRYEATGFGGKRKILYLQSTETRIRYGSDIFDNVLNTQKGSQAM